MARLAPAFTSFAIIFVPLVPALYLPGLMPMIFAERYLYLPSAGFVLLISCLLVIILRRFGRNGKVKAVIIGATVLTVVLYSAAAYKRNQVWHDDYSLWTDTVRKSSNSGPVHFNLGVAAYDLGLYGESASAYESALKYFRKPSNLLDTYNNLGNAYARMGRLEDAASSYENALKIDPSSDFTRGNLEVVKRMMMKRELR